jgi:hypothetical protein
MWAYTPDEQTWLVPGKQWITAVAAAELAKRKEEAGHEAQIPLPLDMPAPYDTFVTDPAASDPK